MPVILFWSSTGAVYVCNNVSQCKRESLPRNKSTCCFVPSCSGRLCTANAADASVTAVRLCHSLHTPQETCFLKVIGLNLSPKIQDSEGITVSLATVAVVMVA